MTRRTLSLDDRLHAYLLDVSLREPDVLRRLRGETAGRAEASMQIAPEQGQLMALLVRLLGARTTLEIGTYTGYSALAVALALPDDGVVVACDVSEEFTSVARRYWDEAGVTERIRLHLAPAAGTLERLLAEGAAGSFDFAFIDADKQGYAGYVEQCHALLRAGGLLAIDNVLWSGKVADPAVNDADTEAIRRLNAALLQDARFDLSLVPIGDGLTLARKR